MRLRRVVQVSKKLDPLGLTRNVGYCSFQRSMKDLKVSGSIGNFPFFKLIAFLKVICKFS